MASESDRAIGRASGECDEPMDVWNVVETALHDLTDEDDYSRESYPANVEVEIRVE